MIPHWCYPYFYIVVGLAWSHDSESYAGSNIATGTAFHLGQVKDDDPDIKGYPGAPDCGLDVRLTNPPSKKILLQNL